MLFVPLSAQHHSIGLQSQYPDIMICLLADYVSISSIRLNTFHRLLHDPLRFGMEDNINTPIVAVRIHESKNTENQLTISNSSNVKLILYFADVSCYPRHIYFS